MAPHPHPGRLVEILRRLAGAPILAILMGSMPAQAGTFASSLAEAQVLLEEGGAEEALRLLDSLEHQGAGDVRYDYLLAIASLDSGRPDRAVAVFDRILAYAPHLVGIRVELAQALVVMGEMQRASDEIHAVLDMPEVPAELMAVAGSLAATLKGAGLTESGDEDAAPPASPLSLRVGALPPQAATRIGEAVFSDGIVAGITLEGALGKVTWHAGAGATGLNQGDSRALSYDARAGMDIGDGKMGWGLTVLASLSVLDGVRISDSHGLSAYGRYQFSMEDQLTLAATLESRGGVDLSKSSNELETRALSLVWSKVDQAQGRQFSLRFEANRQVSVKMSRQTRPHVASLGANWGARVNDRFGMAVEVSAERLSSSGARNHGGAGAGRGVAASIGLDWQPSRDWSLKSSFSWSWGEGLARQPVCAEMALWLRGVF